MKVNRRLGLVAIGILLCVLAWAIWPRRLEQTRTLSDGSELTLRLVTYDRSHREPVGDRWIDRVGSWLPERLARRLGSQLVTAGDTNELRFWLVRSGATNGSVSQFRAVTVDRHGCEFGLGPVSEYPFIQGQRSLWTVGFPVFQRREPNVRLRILASGTNGAWAVAAEFIVPNPDSRRYPTWPAPALPQTNRVDGSDLVLMEAVGGVVAGRGPPTVWSSGERPGVYLRFGNFRRGERTSIWEVTGFNGFSDAAGHLAHSGGYVGGTTIGGDAYFITDGGLCRDESAWNLAVTVARTSDFPLGDLWEIPAVPVQTALNSNSVADVSTNLHGAILQFHGVVGPKSPVPMARRMLNDDYLFHLSCSNLSADVRLRLLRATDQRGTILRVGGAASQGVDHFFAVKIPTDATAVHAVYAVTRTVRLEYRLQPKRVDADAVKRLAR